MRMACVVFLELRHEIWLVKLADKMRHIGTNDTVSQTTSQIMDDFRELGWVLK